MCRPSEPLTVVVRQTDRGAPASQDVVKQRPVENLRATTFCTLRESTPLERVDRAPAGSCQPAWLAKLFSLSVAFVAGLPIAEYTAGKHTVGSARGYESTNEPFLEAILVTAREKTAAS